MSFRFGQPISALIVAVASAALGAVALWQGAPLPGLQPETFSPVAARIAAAVLVLSALGLVVGRTAALLAAATWGVMALLAALKAASAASEALGWVPVAEMAALSVFALWRWREASFARLLVLTFAAMLVLFGAIHLQQRALIASLIPDWIPGSPYWPWFTGGLSIMCGVLCAVGGLARRIGAAAIAAMYASWLVVLHAPRLIAEPASTFEWTFALTALALAGVALAAAQAPVTTVVLSPAPHSAHEPS